MTRGPLPRGAECPRHGAVAIGRPPRRRPSPCRGGDRPAWAAVGAEGWLLANDSDFLLKFMAFFQERSLAHSGPCVPG